MIRLLVIFCLTCFLAGHCAAEPDQNRAEQQLLAVLQWEILWHDSPPTFRRPHTGEANLALLQRGTSLAYCSRELGTCARYKLFPNRNWERVKVAGFVGSQRDQVALLAFEDLKGASLVGDNTALGGPKGLSGLVDSRAEIVWSTKVSLKSRDDIVKQYASLSPERLPSLESWLQTIILPSAGYRSITIGCFSPSDPMVYLLGERVSGRIIFAVFWDSEREEWVQAGMLERPEDAARINQMAAIIRSVTCSTLKFK